MKTKYITIRLEPELRAKIEEEARRGWRTLTAQVTMYLEKGMKEVHGKDNK